MRPQPDHAPNTAALEPAFPSTFNCRWQSSENYTHYNKDLHGSKAELQEDTFSGQPRWMLHFGRKSWGKGTISNLVKWLVRA